MVDSLKKVPHGEQCDQALEHYLKISNEATHFSSLVPEAIEFFKKHYVPQGERKLVYTPGKLEEALNEGWVFDPWLNPSGRPTPVITDRDDISLTATVESVYWILVKGTQEQIVGMDAIAVLPEDDLDEGPEDVMDPYGLRTDFIPYGSDGQPSREPQPGYVIMDKGHVYAKGTVYTLPAKPASPWGLSIQLSALSPHLGVDEAHDVITGILDKKNRGF